MGMQALPAGGNQREVSRRLRAIDAEFSTAYITNVDVDTGTFANITVDGSIILGDDFYSSNWDGTIPLSLPDSGATVGFALDGNAGAIQMQGDVYLGGDLTMTTDGIFRTAATGERIEINNNTFGDRIQFIPSVTVQSNGYIQNFDFDFGAYEWAALNLHGSGLGTSSTNTGYGEISLQSSNQSGNESGSASLLGWGDGNYRGDATVQAQADGAGSTAWLLAGDTGAGDANALVNSITNTGDALVQIAASSSGGGAATISMDADQIEIPDGTDAAPILTNAGNTNTGMLFPNTNEIGFTSGGTRAWMMKKVSNDSRLYATESNDWLENDHVAEEWVFYLDSAAEFTLTKSTLNIPNVYSDTVASTQNVHVDSNGRLRRSTSSLKYKQGWFHVELADLKIPQPIKWWDRNEQRWRVGFGAEHIEEALPFAAEHENYDIRAIVAVLSAKVEKLEKQMEACTCRNS